MGFVCCGVRIDHYTIDEIAREILGGKQECEARAVHLLNSYSLSIATYDVSYRRMLDAAWRNLPDGNPVIWAAWLKGLKTRRRVVRGADLMRSVLRRSSGSESAHYFLGGTDESLGRLLARVGRDYPDVSIAGGYAPPFRELTEEDWTRMVTRVDKARPHIVWVGVGTPKQDWWVHRLASETGAVCVAVGAAFDFLAGTRDEAPKIIQALRMEWLFRLIQEPRRLLPRYTIGMVRFARGILFGPVGT